MELTPNHNNWFYKNDVETRSIYAHQQPQYNPKAGGGVRQE